MKDVPTAAGEPARSAPAVDCLDARAILEGYGQSRLLTRERDDDFRRHLLSCPACMQEYRTTVAATARMGRAVREERERDDPRKQRRERQRRLVVDATSGRGRAMRLRLFLITCALIFLFLQLGGLGSGAPSLDVRWQSGAVEAAGRSLDAGGRHAELFAGDWCLLASDAEVRIEGAGGRFEVAGDARIMVDDATVPRLRLRRGRLRLEGRGAVTTQLGVAELERGRLEVELARGRLELRCVEGHASFTDASGRRDLAQGELFALGAASGGVPPARR